MGGVWSVAPPLRWQPLTYAGFDLFEVERDASKSLLGDLVDQCGGVKITPRQLARILVKENAERFKEHFENYTTIERLQNMTQ